MPMSVMSCSRYMLDGSEEYGDTLLLGYGNVDGGSIHEEVRILKALCYNSPEP